MQNENELKMNDEQIRNKEKLDFYMEQNIPVHVKLKNKTFLNGTLIKELRENVYWLEERKLGEVFLFVSDVYDVTKQEAKE